MTMSMSRRGFLAGVGAGGFTAVAGTTAAAATGGRRPVRAATVIVNGRVFTARPGVHRADAVAVGTDGRILAVGEHDEVRRWIGRGTEILDAAGGTVMPGLHDGHMHPLGAAAQSLNPSLRNGSSTVAELQAVLQGFLDATADQEPDGWLEVTDWNPVGLLPAGTVADRSFLDALRTTRPIYLQGSDFHNSFVNSRALALAGIDRDTPQPTAGEIVKDAAGNPTGLLKDDAQGLVAQVIPPPTAERLRAAYASMATFLLANGVTSFLDAASGEGSLQTYAELIGQGLLHQQVTPALLVDADTAKDPAAAAAYLADLRGRYGGTANLRLTTAKVFLDGVIEFPAQTAALLTPYLDADGRPTDQRGDLYVGDRDFRALAVALDRHGWQLHAHAIGDRAARVALNGYEAAARDSRSGRRPGRRHTVAHLELVHPADVPRFARIGALACMQLQWAVRNVFTLDALRPFLGPERWARLYPARSLARHGATLTGGSDWPVDPFRPFNQIATAIDRTDRSSSEPVPLNAAQGLSRTQALTMHTAGSAFQLQDPGSGTITPGARADLIVLDRDVTRVPVDDIRGTVVRQTLISGQVRYDSGATGAARAAAAFGRTLAAGAAVAARSGSAAGRHSCCGAGRH